MTYVGPATLELEDAQVEATVDLRTVYASVLARPGAMPVAWEGEARAGEELLRIFRGRTARLYLPDGRHGDFIGRHFVDGQLKLAGMGPAPFDE